MFVCMCVRACASSCPDSLWFSRDCCWGCHHESEVSSPKSLRGSSLIGAAWYYSIKSSCQRDMNVWLLWAGNKKTISSCMTTETTNIIAENVISTRTLLHLELRKGRRGISDHVFGICEPFVGWQTRRLWKASQPLPECSTADRWSYSLWAGLTGGVWEDPLRRWQSAENKAGVFLLREKQSCLLLRGLLCHLGLQFVGKGIIVMSRKWGIYSVPSIYCSVTGLYFLSRQRLKGSKAGAGWPTFPSSPVTLYETLSIQFDAAEILACFYG